MSLPPPPLPSSLGQSTVACLIAQTLQQAESLLTAGAVDEILIFGSAAVALYLAELEPKFRPTDDIDINSIGVELRLVNADLEIRQKDLRMWPLAKDFQDAVEATTLIGLERTSAFLLHPIPDAEGCQTTL